MIAQASRSIRRHSHMLESGKSKSARYGAVRTVRFARSNRLNADNSALPLACPLVQPDPDPNLIIASINLRI
jgi:hypothetical protein